MPVKFSKLIPQIAAFVFLVGLTSGTQSAPAGDTAAYLAARDRYIGEYKSRPEYSPTDQPLVDLEHRLKAIIPPWQAPGFPAEGRINLDTLQQDLGFGNLDGLRYEAGGTEVIVTTPALARNWMADHNGGSDIAQPLKAAIRSDELMGSVRVPDEGWFYFGEVPVKISGGTGAVLLATDTDSGFVDDGHGNGSGPKYLLATVLRDDRVFVARQKLAINVSYQPTCGNQYRKESASHNAPQIQVPTEQAVSDFRACFAPHLHEQPKYDAIQKQAQALVDLLH